MQVFSPALARSKAEERTAKDALRAKGLVDITKELLQEKKRAEDDFEKTMLLQQEINEKWFADNIARKKSLEEEVIALEKRRKDALSPLLIKEEDIKTVADGLLARELEVSARETDNEEESRSLMRKLDEVSTEKQNLAEREKRVKRMELGAETQKNQVAEDARRFNLQLAEFQKKVEDKETEFAFRDSELDAKENLYSERERSFEGRENEIAASMRLLADQRLLLAKGFEELRRKELKLKQ